MKRQVSNIKSQVILLVCIFALCACEKVTVNIPVDSLTIQLDDILVGDDGVKSGMIRLADDALNSFHATQVIDLNKLNGITEEVKKDQSKITKVEVGSTSSITITVTGSDGTVVKDFLIEADGINSFAVANYDLGEPYSENVAAFASQLLLKLFKGSVSLTISGKTDVPEGAKLRVFIRLNDVVFKVKAL